MPSIEVLLWGGERVDVWSTSTDHNNNITTTDHHIAEEPCVRQALDLQTPPAQPAVGRSAKFEPGTYRFDFRTPLEAGFPASWNGPSDVPVPKVRGSGGDGFSFVGVAYEVRAEARVGRGDYMSATQPFTVVEDAPAPVFRKAEAHASRRGEQAPGLRLALDYVDVSPGALIRGTVRLTRPPRRRLRRVRVVFTEVVVGKEKPGRRRNMRKEERAFAQLEIPGAGAAERDEPFEVRVPLGTLDSRAGAITSRRHFVEARADLALARDLKVKTEIRVLPGSRAKGPPGGRH